jgi:hypothetical protein
MAGSGDLIGSRNTFDIAFSNSENKCGDNTAIYRSSRKYSFSSSPTQTYSWYSATGSAEATAPYENGVCQMWEGVDDNDAHPDWRAPNLAELAQIGQLASDYDGLVINSGIGSRKHVNKVINQSVSIFPAGSYPMYGTYNLITTSGMPTNYDLSSTEANTEHWQWSFSSNKRYTNKFGKGGSSFLRCVRPF